MGLLVWLKTIHRLYLAKETMIITPFRDIIDGIVLPMVDGFPVQQSCAMDMRFVTSSN
jgi:hypothetical protein